MDPAVIAIVLSMVRARPARALTTFVLAMLAVAAAVSAPHYVAAADRAVVASAITGAKQSERTVQVRRAALGTDRQFERVAPQLFTIPGFQSVFGTEFDAFVTNGPNWAAPRLVYRDDVCRHLRVVAGRCYAGVTELVISPDAAKVLKAGVGSALNATQATRGRDGYEPIRASIPVPVTVVGIVEPIDAGEAYWSDAGYFVRDPGERMITAPAFTSRLTLELIKHDRELQSLDVVVGDDAITADTLRVVNAGVQESLKQLKALPGSTVVTTELPNLLARTDRNRRLVAQIVPVAAAPLVVLCWFVLFLAVAAGTQERRHELGLVALRGVRTPHRWWLAAGESVVPILLGALAGYFAGRLAVRLAVAVLLDHASGPLPPAPSAGRWALVAVAGALAAGLLAQRRELAQPTVDLLRDVPSRAGRWRAAVIEAVVLLLAVVAVVQVRTDTSLSGVAVLAPALVVLAIGLLAARAVGPAADRAGARALRRGRIGPMLAAYALSRRPGSQRILALLVVAVALLCFAATAVDVGRQARDELAAIQLGAARVLTVDVVTGRALLVKTHAADPDGRWAMAVTTMPGERGQAGSPRMLAVDATRLPAVAGWNGNPGAADVAQALHPEAVRAPLALNDQPVEVDLTLRDLRDGFRVRVAAVVQPDDGSPVDEVDLGPVQPGRHTYQNTAPACLAGCGLIGIELRQPEGRGFSVDATLHELRQGGRTLVGAAQFTEAGAWRAPESPGAALRVPTLQAEPDGLRLQLTDARGNDVEVMAMPADSPSPLPVALTRDTALDSQVKGIDGSFQTVEAVREVAQLPRLGTAGALVDLDYIDRAAITPREILTAEVWLGRAAPADALDRLREQGLVVLTDRRLDVLQQALDEQGPAVAVRFYELAAGFAVLLAVGGLRLVAGVDRRRRAGEARALRMQGVSRRDAGATGYVAIAGTAVLAGPVAALLTWLLVGDRLPVFVDEVVGFDAPHWPGIAAFGLAWLAGAVVFLSTALLGSRVKR